MECFTPAQVQEAFLAAPPLIAQTILDLTVTHPSWLSDIWDVGDWPLGNGTVMEQLVFRGEMPPIERGFDNWKKLGNLQGCEPCDAPDCSYNWTPFGGHGFQRKLTELMSREFRSPSYCINEIQTTAHFQEVFAKIVENLYRQTAFFKEFNIGLNFLTYLAKKYVVDSEGAKPNTTHPYIYPNIGTATLSALNIEMLEFFYESLRHMPDAVPYDVVNGSPIYAIMASHQLFSRLYRDDPNLRQDVRFSGFATDLLTKYNFMSTIRGMFIPAPILYPRRFNIVDGEPQEVLPFVNGVPAEVGTYTYVNPNYEAATHEEVLIHGKFPFKIFTMPTETSLAGSATFGPGFTFMNNWMWVNPPTVSDPFRRVGYFATEARLGLSQQFSEGIFAVLVTRPSRTLMAMYTPVAACPPDPADCDNAIPAMSCPCPVVMSIQANPLTAGNFYFIFASAITGDVDSDVVLELDSGATITGNLEAISDDGKTAEISFAAPLDVTVCTQIVGVNCNVNTACSANVLQTSDCRSGITGNIVLTLDRALRVQAADVITAWFGDCTTANLDIVSVDPVNMQYTANYAAGFGPTDDEDGNGGSVLAADLVCNRGGISKVCVPPTTDATCPACEVSIADCEEPST